MVTAAALALVLSQPPLPPDDVLARAQALMAQGGYREALSALEPLTHESLTALQRSKLFQQLAAARSQTGPDDLALRYADEGEQAARTVAAYDVLARIESVRGIVWLNRGRSLESLTHLKACLDWATKSKQPALIAGAYIRLAAAYQDQGDWARALDAVNRSGDADPSPTDSSRVQYLTRRGLVEIELHEDQAAKASVQSALELARQVGDRRTLAQVLIDRALVIERADRDPRQAIPFAAEAVEIAHEMGMPSLEIPALNQLGGLRLAAGEYGAARQTLVRAIDVIGRSRERRDEPYVLNNLGAALVGLGRVEDGVRVLRQAADRADAANLTRARWVARLRLAEVDSRRDPAAAEREFQAVLDILEDHQSNVLLEGFRAGGLSPALGVHDPYDRYIAFLLDRHEPLRAFYVAERERARTFLDRLSLARDAVAATLPPGFADAEHALLAEISSAQAALRRDAEGGRREALLATIDRTETALTALRVRLAAERPALAHARYPVLWNPDALRERVLASDERLVSYFLGADASVCWIVDKSGVRTIRLPSRAEIEARVRDALQDLRNPLETTGSHIAALASVLAIDQLDGPGGATRVMIVPHGILNDIPFEALPIAPGRALVERYAVSYLPSASSLPFFRSLPPLGPSPVTLLAVGNPIVSETASAPRRQVDLARVNLLAPLPHTAEEVRRVADLFGDSARTLEGEGATESAVRARMADARLLHFATHGLIDEDRPERSGLVLTAKAPDDGLLQMREIYSLKIAAQLVTLSACDTALGRYVTGEGMIGLTRAFFYAGAHAVLASLWDIEDASTSDLMQRFYANLRRGDAIDVALQRAKIAGIARRDRGSHPFFWAPFVVTGDARAIVDVRPAANTRLMDGRVPLSALAGAAFLLAVSAWLYRKRLAR